ncbi:peptidoglycan DD-metalloendopeptidase family protein [Leptospira ilyithenensis]|uniref:M23ase beta-sheet core domain-containing protein n=1 Tax=Leptospira ilyithenensis TaxID=2484901 RepID=A0A4R9LPP3_9LEPT|nr:peptidoglycan DD-metalloendopeptidase family protein [Leptospira ilyithenensis]TGN11054.1 hypothetical protein EHS11_07780 [Leptospira ilyithenensis]
MLLRSLIFFFLIASHGFAESISEHWSKIEKKTKAEDWEGAKTPVADAISEYPNERDFRITEAWVWRSSGNPEESLKRIRKAISQWQKDELLKEQLSYSLCSVFDSLYRKAGYKREQLPKEALSIAEEAYQAKDTEWSTNIYGISLRMQKRFKESVQHYQKGIKKYPNAKYYPEELAYSYLEPADEELKKENPKLAIELANKAILLLPENEWANLILAYSWQKLNPEKAIPYFEKAAKLNPTNEHTIPNMGYSYQLLIEYWIKNKENTKITKNFPIIKNYSELPAKQGMSFLRAWVPIADATEEFESLVEFLKKKIIKYPDDIELKILCGSVLNKLNMKQRRSDSSLADSTQRESNRYLREGMELFEKQNPNRLSFKGIQLPLNGKIIIAAAFDGGGTHSGFEKYSYDFLHVDESHSTLRPNTKGTENSDYYTFGESIYAIEGGVVLDTKDGFSDNVVPGEISFGPGNDLQILHDNGLISHYAHIKKGSIRVKKGQRVNRGEKIAEVGNSGMSYGPHLHFTVVTKDWISTYYEWERLKIKTPDQIIFGSQPLEKNWVIEK